MSYKILGADWYTPPLVGILFDALTGISENLSVGIVAIESGPPAKDGTISWKAYLGYGTSGDEKQDQQSIAANGVKVTKEVASATFPQLPLEGFKY